MKTKLLLLLIVLFSFACSKEEIPTKQPIVNYTAPEQCDCVKTYYIYYPAMGSGASYIPAHYDVTRMESGKFACALDTNQYVQFYTEYSTHYKIDCN